MAQRTLPRLAQVRRTGPATRGAAHSPQLPRVHPHSIPLSLTLAPFGLIGPTLLLEAVAMSASAWQRLFVGDLLEEKFGLIPQDAPEIPPGALIGGRLLDEVTLPLNMSSPEVKTLFLPNAPIPHPR